jgi:thioredoxin reductase (NADPH)
MTMPKEILTEDIREILREGFKQLRDDVRLLVFTQKGVNDQFNEFMTGIVTELSGIDKKIKPGFYTIESPDAKKYNVDRSPTLLIAPDKYNIRYTGAPLGEEGRSLITAIIMVSTGQSIISDDSKKRLSGLGEKRHVRVFVSPTCPYCPQQVLYAICAAVERRDLVSVEVIEIYENRDLAERYAAMSVPKTFIGEEPTASGLQSEEYFMESLVEGKAVKYVMPSGREELRDYDIIIIGGGPAGLTAAIYAERSGLKSIVFEKANIGGQIVITPVVENYPGVGSMAGKTLVELMSRQAMEYAAVLQGVGVDDIKKSDGIFEVSTNRGIYKARAIIVATGASHRTLNVPGEKRLSGRGVSYCAICDGYLFKDGKTAVVVGGGNSALTDALYLDSLGAHVIVVYRGDSFKAEQRLQQGFFQRNIEVIWASRIVEIIGKRIVEKLMIEDVLTGEVKEIRADAVFIAIGYEPMNEIAVKLGLKLDGEGYIKVDGSQRTSVPFVYSAGDVTGGVKQITVAVGQGSVAAITAFEDLKKLGSLRG